jgi:hypothetical protein
LTKNNSIVGFIRVHLFYSVSLLSSV